MEHHSISKRLGRALSEEGATPILLLDIVGKGGASAFLADTATRVQWNGKTYEPAAMRHTPVDEKLPITTTIEIADPDPQIAELLARAAAEGAEISLRRTDRRTLLNPRDAVQMTAGRLHDFLSTDAGISFGIMGVVGMLGQAR